MYIKCNLRLSGCGQSFPKTVLHLQDWHFCRMWGRYLPFSRSRYTICRSSRCADGHLSCTIYCLEGDWEVWPPSLHHGHWDVLLTTEIWNYLTTSLIRYQQMDKAPLFQPPLTTSCLKWTRASSFYSSWWLTTTTTLRRWFFWRRDTWLGLLTLPTPTQCRLLSPLRRVFISACWLVSRLSWCSCYANPTKFCNIQ